MKMNVGFIRFVSSLFYFVAILLSLAALPANAASQYLMQLDGIKGASTAKGFKNWIDISSFQWSVSTAVSSPSLGGVRQTGSPKFSDLVWTQTLDSSTPMVFQNEVNGTLIPKATIAFLTPTSSGTPVKYFDMVFNNVYIDSVSLSGGGGNIPTVLGSFTYDKVTFDYYTLSTKGGISNTTTATWDIATNVNSYSALLSVYAQGNLGPTFIDTSPIPEPDTSAMIIVGLGLLGFVARRKQV